MVHTYKERNDNFKELGFSSYEDYRNSQLWKDIKKKNLKDRCSLCDYPATVLHHHYYTKEALQGTDLEAFASLCDTCHHKIHFRTLEETRILYDRLTGKPKNNVRKLPNSIKRNNKCTDCSNSAKRGKTLCRRCNKKKKAEQKT